MAEGALGGQGREGVAAPSPVVEPSPGPGFAPSPPRGRARGAERWAGVRARADRRWLLWGAVLLLLVLGAVAPVKRTGDAHQYYAMAFAFGDLRPPALTPAEMADFKAWRDAQPLDSWFPGSGLLDQPNLIHDGRQEFSHFWFYPLLASPFVALAEALGLHPGRGFLAINALLLALAVWRVGKAFRPEVGLLLLASPIVWWVDKAQVELFTFALLAIAMAEAVRGRFLWAALAAAAAATQNAPILALPLLLWGAGALRWLLMGGWAALRGFGASRGTGAPMATLAIGEEGGHIGPPLPIGDQGRHRPGAPGPVPQPGGRRWRWGALRPTRATVALVAATVLVGAAHPVYYLVQLGVATPQRLNGGFEPGWPSLGLYLAPLLDPDLGLFWWAPLVVGVAALGAVPLLAAGWRGEAGRRRLDRRLSAGCALAGGVGFLFAFTQTPNLNSGGTVHMVRYATWLLPLTLPFLEEAAWGMRRVGRGPARVALAVGVVALVVYAAWLRPSRSEVYLGAAPQSEALIAWAPRLYLALPGPVAEIFYERRTRRESVALGADPGSAATPDCRLLLLSRSAPFTRCAVTEAEWRAAGALFEDGWRSVWVTREGALGFLGGAGVRGAARGGERPPPVVNPAEDIPAWERWASRELAWCQEQTCAPTIGLERTRGVRGGVELLGWVSAPPGQGPPRAMYLVFANEAAAPVALGRVRRDVAEMIGRADAAGTVGFRAIVGSRAIPWRSGAVCPTSVRVIDASGTGAVEISFPPGSCGLLAPPALGERPRAGDG